VPVVLGLHHYFPAPATPDVVKVTGPPDAVTRTAAPTVVGAAIP
jgi:hypothetical protein